jgi:hypothetical protein
MRQGQLLVNLDKQPEECPICHRFSQPIDYGIGFAHGDRVERFFRCPREECDRTFIARYAKRASGVFALTECVPHEAENEAFGEIIQKVSTKFCEIYEQSSTAEQQSLLLICGPGYRKAFEFLVKDYICGILPAEEADAIKKTPLAKCIKDHITNPKIVAVASRATWLGNDETHYLRTWEDKDLSDLKKLIELTVLWIEMEELTKAVVVDMPAPQKP